VGRPSAEVLCMIRNIPPRVPNITLTDNKAEYCIHNQTPVVWLTYLFIMNIVQSTHTQAHIKKKIKKS